MKAQAMAADPECTRCRGTGRATERRYAEEPFGPRCGGPPPASWEVSVMCSCVIMRDVEVRDA